MKISYAITVKDELEEIQQLIPFLLEHKRKEDEIVVLWDNKGSQNVRDFLMDYSSLFPQLRSPIDGEFNNHFADWKNKLTSFCSGDYIFNIDADELPSQYMMEALPNIIQEYPNLDMILIPRINTVEGLTIGHIKQWGWNVNDNNWINFPDCQMRIYRNSPNIKWVNAVHERLEGFKEYTTIVDPMYALIHHKTIERQERQNKFYEQFNTNSFN
jgi:hypothetical protein